jgi:hypothetical protein
MHERTRFELRRLRKHERVREELLNALRARATKVDVKLVRYFRDNMHKF